ncbi:MAG: transposase [Anaerolineales bacterium]|nr:transposase [Anaerolineales bacterium]
MLLQRPFPVAVCDNYRIKRCRLYQGEAYRGFIASKKRYFYGLKIHLVVTKDGQPVEFFLTPGADSDVACLDLFDFDLPPGSEVYADRIYTHYALEDVLSEAGILFKPLRKKNLTRQWEPWERYWISLHRKMIETTGSLIERILPKSIHAVTSVGFELKVSLFILAMSFGHVLKVAT